MQVWLPLQAEDTLCCTQDRAQLLGQQEHSCQESSMVTSQASAVISKANCRVTVFGHLEL